MDTLKLICLNFSIYYVGRNDGGNPCQVELTRTCRSSHEAVPEPVSTKRKSLRLQIPQGGQYGEL